MRSSDLRTAFAKVFTRPGYIAVGAGSSFALLILSLWLASARLIGFILGTSFFSPAAKIRGVAEVLWGSFAASRPSQLVVTLVTALLFGLNTAMTVYYLRCRISLQRSAGASIVATIFGILGVGCASCGSVLLSSIFGTAAAAGLLHELPYDGLEFGLIGAVIMAGAVWYTARKVATPEACPIPRKK